MIRYGLCLTVLLSFTAPAAAAPARGDDAELLRSIRFVGSSYHRGLRPGAQRTLREAGPAALETFRAHFEEIDHNTRNAFQQEVAQWPARPDVDRFLLEEFRKGLPVHRRIVELVAPLGEGQETYELVVAWEKMRTAYDWWRWVLRARPDLGFVSSYEEVYALFVEEPPRLDLIVFAKALRRIAPERALADFKHLIADEQEALQWKGIKGYRAIRELPDAETRDLIFRHCRGEALKEAEQFIYRIPRSEADRVLPLVAHASEGVRNAAQRQMGRFGRRTLRQFLQIRDRPMTPQERLVWWQAWWAERKDWTDEALRAEGVKAALAEAADGITQETIYELINFPDAPEIYPLFQKALVAPDTTLRDSAAMQLGNLAVAGHKMAVDTALAVTADLPPDRAVPILTNVARSRDRRVADRLLTMLEAESGERENWPAHIRAALPSTGDERAIDVLVRCVIEKGEQRAASALAEIEGAERAMPQLLDALLKEPDRNKRFAIRMAVEFLADSRVAPQLVQLLGEAAPGAGFDQGPRSDVLQLMEVFPDPEAGPVLQELLKADDPWARLYAARVLGRLGDTSGAAVVIECLETKEPVPWHFQGHDIGAALKSIGAPDTRERLVAAFARAEGKDRERILAVMAQQQDPAYVEFFAGLLGDADERMARLAAGGFVQTLRGRPGEERLAAIALGENDLPPIRDMLLWAFLDRRIRPGDPAFSGEDDLKGRPGALLTVDRWRHIVFETAGGTVRLVVGKPDESLLALEGTPPGRGKPYARGSLTWIAGGRYVAIGLNISAGGWMYLFRRDGERWTPVRPVAGWAE